MSKYALSKLQLALPSVSTPISQIAKHMFSTQHAWVPPTSETGSRYKYGKALYTLPTSIGNMPPSAKTTRTGMESPPRPMNLMEGEEEHDFSEVQEEVVQPKEVWVTKTNKRARSEDDSS